MNNQALHHSSAWVAFTYATFLLALGMIAIGVVMMPIEFYMKAFLGMAVVMLVQSCITLTKTLRDNEEATKLAYRIEDAKTERLLKETAHAP